MFEELALGLSFVGIAFSFILICFSIALMYFFWNWFKRKMQFEIIIRKRNYLPEVIEETEKDLKVMNAIKNIQEAKKK